MRINQQKIAEELKLSRATVSRSLRGNRNINSGTRARVLEAARQMGYQVPGAPLAREGANGRFLSLGALIYGHSNAGSGNFVPQHFLQGMSQAAHEVNASMAVHYVSHEDRDRLTDPEFQPVAMREGQLSGLILMRHFPAHIVQALSATIPCVALTHSDPAVAVDCISANDGQGIGQLMDHLYAQGHRNIGFAGDPSNFSWNQARFAAYLQSLVRLGLPYEPARCLDVSWAQQNIGAEVEAVVTQCRKGVTAWVCANDPIGYLLMARLPQHGLSVPQDVSVTGFDAIEPPLGQKQLTCMRPPFEAMGAAAVRRLLERINSPDCIQQHSLFRCEFVEGETVAAAAK